MADVDYAIVNMITHESRSNIANRSKPRYLLRKNRTVPARCPPTIRCPVFLQVSQASARRSHALRTSSSAHIRTAKPIASNQAFASIGAVPNNQLPAEV